MDFKTILRIVELVVCVVLLVLWYALTTYASRVMIICGTIFGFTIICSVLLAREFFDFNDTLIYLLIGAILFLICGGVTVATLPDSSDGKLSYFIATALFIANGVIFLIDFIMEFKGNSQSID
ncbi:uncharacterized protein LOC105665577 [Ceratitis capitata]|uniref:uncharacterized protein LOC105665577 n=1 Tax=Ceratitis capitata TaxID=7213 RepID=UPI0006187F34|nr:uncharacterized protein LOC105665577 [Ceratitis capitata]